MPRAMVATKFLRNRKAQKPRANDVNRYQSPGMTKDPFNAEFEGFDSTDVKFWQHKDKYTPPTAAQNEFVTHFSVRFSATFASEPPAPPVSTLLRKCPMTTAPIEMSHDNRPKNPEMPPLAFLDAV